MLHGHSNASNGGVVRTALKTREDGAVDLLLQIVGDLLAVRASAMDSCAKRSILVT